jgi:hypothetical protein
VWVWNSAGVGESCGVFVRACDVDLCAYMCMYALIVCMHVLCVCV